MCSLLPPRVKRKKCQKIFIPFLLYTPVADMLSWPEPAIEHLVGRQGQPRGVHVYAVHLSNWKGWSQDPRLPRPHLRVGSIVEVSRWRFLPT